MCVCKCEIDKRGLVNKYVFELLTCFIAFNCSSSCFGELWSLNGTKPNRVNSRYWIFPAMTLVLVMYIPQWAYSGVDEFQIETSLYM